MALLQRASESGLFVIEDSKARDIGDARPRESRRIRDGGFALIIEAFGRRAARRLAAEGPRRAESIAENEAARRPSGTRVIVGQAFADLNGTPIFRKLSSFTVR